MRKTLVLAALFLLALVPATVRAHTVKAQSVSTYILLDRTGSMSPIWDEALTSVNAYAVDLGKETPEDAGLKTSITLAVFDHQGGLQFDVLRNHVVPAQWRNLTSTEASPRGMTPLYDAIGRMVALAEKDSPKQAVIVIMTDGEENSSTEFNQGAAKAALDRARARGWEVVFLGAEFAKFSDAGAMGVDASQTMAVSKDGMTSTMQNLAKKNRSYGQSEGKAKVVFDDKDRATANEEEVKNKQQ
ncbi:vWA domain-containing protein [Asticcacaulis sp. AC402]|uniref:vWA domain-containing protein n=1 Tax=Asticcacaulis sp. AC402 TaxID=1282361 RepID=UPI0003C3D7D0|nr:vWA domain-containing protein [Asticcacaulis sp. AC402]ESQ74937.1 hypothetical protein ABAC402_12345 [Asticcacaulis sp. AC402]